ncbi:MAG: hypothetical protein ABFE16_14835 [Armatimonadia bacterium]
MKTYLAFATIALVAITATGWAQPQAFGGIPGTLGTQGTVGAQGTLGNQAVVTTPQTWVMIPIQHADPATIAMLFGGSVIYDMTGSAGGMGGNGNNGGYGGGNYGYGGYGGLYGGTGGVSNNRQFGSNRGNNNSGYSENYGSSGYGGRSSGWTRGSGY